MRDPYLVAKLKQKYKDEQVLVVREKDTAMIPNGFSSVISKPALDLFQTAQYFVYRYDAEYNNVFVQLIPYIVIKNVQGNMLWITERIAGEERLQGKLSIGCGGHINIQDMSSNTIMTAAKRELNEELDIKLEDSLKVFGTVRDINSNTKEHLGLVYLATAAEVQVREKDTLRGEWMNIKALVSNYSKFESWGRLIIDHLFVNYKKTRKLF